MLYAVEKQLWMWHPTDPVLNPSRLFFLNSFLLITTELNNIFNLFISEIFNVVLVLVIVRIIQCSGFTYSMPIVDVAFTITYSCLKCARGPGWQLYTSLKWINFDSLWIVFWSWSHDISVSDLEFLVMWCFCPREFLIRCLYFFFYAVSVSMDTSCCTTFNSVAACSFVWWTLRSISQSDCWCTFVPSHRHYKCQLGSSHHLQAIFNKVVVEIFKLCLFAGRALAHVC